MKGQLSHSRRAVLPAWVGLVLALALVLGAGCAIGEPVPPAAKEVLARAEASPTFRLRHPMGEQLTQQTRLAANLVLPNCDAAEPYRTEYTQRYAPEADLVLDAASLPESLAPWRGVMAALVRQSYRSANLFPSQAEHGTILEAAAQQEQAYRLTWVETWDENVLEVLLEGELVAEVPVLVLTEVALAAQAGEAAACDGASLGHEARVPLILALGSPLEAPEAPGEPPPCEPPLAMTAAQQQVARYVELLQAGDHATAYAMLAEGYRLRLPYRQYVAGYGPVRGLALCSLETVGAIGGAREAILATLRISLEIGGQVEEQLWEARYEVQRDGAIASVSMYKATLGDE